MEYIKTPTIGEMLKEEFMDPLGLSAYSLAKSINVPVSRIQDILHGRRKISIDTSLRLGKFFCMSDDFFLRLQNDIDIRMRKEKLREELNKIEPSAINVI